MSALPVRDVSHMVYSGQPIVMAEAFEKCAEAFERRNERLGEELCK